MLYEKTITRAMFERSSDFLDVAARRARKSLRLPLYRDSLFRSTAQKPKALVAMAGG